jgi:uncharacterized damage-inducible protein DinB
MNTQDLKLLYDYNCWANQRILSAAERVPTEQYASARLGYCQLHDTLVHIYSAERRWRSRWQGGPSAPMLAAGDVSTLVALRELWSAEEQQLRVYLGGLSDADLMQVLSYSRSNGSLMTNVLWHMLVHMVNHGTQHRAELAMLLTELGHSPGDIDFIVFLRARGL